MGGLDSDNEHNKKWIERKNKVLECLNGRELGYKQIMQETKLKYASVAYMLNDLELAKIIKSRSVDGNKLYSVNDQLPSDAML